MISDRRGRLLESLARVVDSPNGGTTTVGDCIRVDRLLLLRRQGREAGSGWSREVRHTQAARITLDDVERLGLWARRQSAGISSSMVIVFGAFYVLLFVLAALADAIDLEIWPQLTPVPGTESLGTLWQVQASLVAIALPFFFALVAMLREEELAATRIAEVLTEDTFVNPILVFSLFGTVWTGFAVGWLDHASSKWLALLFVLVPTVAGVAYIYSRAAKIIVDPLYTRASRNGFF